MSESVSVSLTAGNETFPGGSYLDNTGNDSVLGTGLRPWR